MAYRPGQFYNVRDKAYPSEIAAQRPILAPRIHCVDEERYETTEDSVRGSEGNRVELFNAQLRKGHLKE